MAIYNFLRRAGISHYPTGLLRASATGTGTATGTATGTGTTTGTGTATGT